MSTALTTEEIKRLANLSRLSLSQEELESAGKDIAAILGFVDTIQSVQLGGTITETIDQKNVFREDAVQPLQSAHDLIEAAPLHQDHFVKVPKVIE